MAIDADLNAGIIDQEDAKNERRAFSRIRFLWIDGRASKFVRGDAIAGILILIINIVGGLIVGTSQHDLSIGRSWTHIRATTIGDGLVAQIPPFVIARDSHSGNSRHNTRKYGRASSTQVRTRPAS